MNKHGLDQYLRRLTPEEEEHLSGIHMDYSAMPVQAMTADSPATVLYMIRRHISAPPRKKTFWWNTIISP